MSAPQKPLAATPAARPAPADFEAKFAQWFAGWGADLWSICVFTSHPSLNAQAGAVVSAREEFQEMLVRIRKRMRTSASRWPAEAVAGAFLKEWIRLQRLKHSVGGLHAVDLPPQDRALVGAVFKAGWSFEKVAQVFDLSPTSVRYRALQALRRMLPLSAAGGSGPVEFPASRLTPYSRDCVRLELYVLDHLVGLKWKDPLRFFGPQDLELHRQSCSRCQAFCEGLDEGLKQMKLSALPPLPDGLLERIRLESTLSSRWWLFTWISTWPWVLRIPLQLAFVATVVFAVVTVPYLGDLFPDLNRYLPNLSDSLRHVAAQKSESPTNLAHQSVAPPVPAPAPAPAAAPEVKSSLVAATKIETPAIPMPVFEITQKPAVTLPLKGVKVVQSAPAPVPVPAPVPKPKPSVPVQAAPAAALPVAVAKSEVKAEPKAEAKAAAAGKKLFYRWGAFTGDLDGDARKITAVLERYGVERAGEFDLGARHLGGAYYHFYVNDEDYDQLVEDLRALGLDQFTRSRAVGEKKDQPEGQTRIVFLIRPKLGGDE